MPMFVTDGYDDVIRWCESENLSLIQAVGGDTYKTERNSRLDEGVIIYNYGAGAIQYFTDNNGDTFVPPSTVTLSVTARDQSGNPLQNMQVRIERNSDGTLITEGTTNASGVFSDSFTYTGDLSVNVIVRRKGFKPNRSLTTITATGLTSSFTMITDPSVNLP